MADHVQVSKALYFVIVEAGNLIFAEHDQGICTALFRPCVYDMFLNGRFKKVT